jgi:hypothetical protein
MAGARQLSDMASPRLIPQTPGPLAPARRNPIGLKVIVPCRRPGGTVDQACDLPAQPVPQRAGSQGRQGEAAGAEGCGPRPRSGMIDKQAGSRVSPVKRNPRGLGLTLRPRRGLRWSSSSSRPSFVLVDHGLPLRGVGHLQVANPRIPVRGCPVRLCEGAFWGAGCLPPPPCATWKRGSSRLWQHRSNGACRPPH